MGITLQHYQTLSLILFFLGAVGVMARRNIFVILIGIEMMMNAANLSLVSYGRFIPDVDGQVLALFVMAIAAAEICIGLAMVICMFRLKQTLGVDAFTRLKR